MLERLWSRVKALLARLFRRNPPEPGRFESDKKSAFRGFLSSAPWIWPGRDYLLYIPRGHGRWRPVPLLVLIHGCRQTPEDIAAGTRITAMADELGCLVLLPRQNPRANGWGCWNWFDQATAQGWGETAIVAAQIESVRFKYRIDPRRIFAAGMSSGGALAAALGVRRSDLVTGVFAHSGLACGAASSPVSAHRVLLQGADKDVAEIARDARAKAKPGTLPVPLVAVQGVSDTVVPPLHAIQLVRQYLALNGHAHATAGSANELPPSDRAISATLANGRVMTTSEWRIGNRLAARHVLIQGLGHAWSGGDEAYAYNDAEAPDATALLRAFIGEPVG